MKKPIFLLIIFIPSFVFGASRKSVELYGQNAGSRARSYADHSRSIANQLNNQSVISGGGLVNQDVYSSVGLKFSVLWPISFFHFNTGFSVSGGLGPAMQTRLTSLPDIDFNEKIDSRYWRAMFEIEKNKWFKSFNFSLRGGIGILEGKISHSTRTDFFNISPFPSTFSASEEQKWKGLTFDLIPSIGMGDGRREIRVGFGLRYLPKTPAMSNLPSFDTSKWSGSISYLW